MTRREKMSEVEVAENLGRVPGWEIRAGKLHRELRFDHFAGAFGFMASIAVIAEKMDHHPEWSNVYSRVVIDLSTHDAGGITESDFLLAEAVNRLAP